MSNISKIKKVIESCETLDQHWLVVSWVHGCSKREVISFREYLELSITYLDKSLYKFMELK
jgi:hypothetical protein